jgi:hypothetical protein
MMARSENTHRLQGRERLLSDRNDSQKREHSQAAMKEKLLLSARDLNNQE